MSRKRKQQKFNNKRGGGAIAAPSRAEMNDLQKRKTLKTLRNSVIGLIVVGGISAYGYRVVVKSREEHDLTQIGKGTPTIVQIHDPNCGLCTALQREVRKALGGVNKGAVDYRVANIRTKEGRRFASHYGVPHVTLLLFDGRGKLQQTLRGPRESNELEVTFNVLADMKGT